MQNSERNILKLKLKNDTIKNKESVDAIISNYNTVKDIEKIMENFNNNNIQYPQKKGIIINTGNNTLRVEFNNEEHLNEFISYISFIKYENPLYKSIIIKKDSNNIIKKDNKIFLNNNISFLNSIKKRNYKKNNKNISLSKSASSRSQLNNAKIKINISDIIKVLKNNNLNHDKYHGLSLYNNDENEIVTKFYQQQDFIRNSSPYISENEKKILEEKESKKYFLKHNNFVTSVGKYSMKPNFIKNYVGLIPGENPKLHEFREFDKNKWIDKKGFYI